VTAAAPDLPETSHEDPGVRGAGRGGAGAVVAPRVAHGHARWPYDPNVGGSRNEMRSFVCSQCHVEYYCSTKLPLTLTGLTPACMLHGREFLALSSFSKKTPSEAACARASGWWAMANRPVS
jgi:hypothetical protein